jgi:hypothetical protein
MARKRTDMSAARFASEAETQLNEMNRAMQSARDSLAGLTRALHVPVPQGGSRTIRGSRSRLSLLDTAGLHSIGGFLSGQIISGGGDFIDDLSSLGIDTGDFLGGGSFQQSSTQFAAGLFGASLRGQRIW